MSNNNLSRPLFRFQGLHPFFKPRRGFTLIELLIVVAIISILVAIGLAAFTTAQRGARDSQRQSDVGEVAGALGLYYGDNNSYPETFFGQIVCDGVGKQFGTSFDCGMPPVVYLTQLPSDPLCNTVPNCMGDDYIYISCNPPTNPQNYTLYTRLERPPPPLPAPTCTPVPAGKNFWINSQ